MGKKGRRHSQGGNKKSKNRRESEETADDNDVQVEGSKKCSHVTKAAKLGVLQNNIPHMKMKECCFCGKGQNEDAGICMCLRCGKQGCDRYSEDKHALSHYESTSSHCLTLNLNNMMVWCYSCDMEVHVQPNTDLQECIKLLLKTLKMNAPNDQIPSTPNVACMKAMKNSEAIKCKHNSNSNKIKGLVNLGNTCFFNSVMQNLFQTELLHVAMAFVNQKDYFQTITTKSNLPSLSVQVTTSPGSLITALTKLLYEYRSSSPGPLNPKFLFSEISKKAPRFRGFQQQDSQELLRYLLDSVKTEQLRRAKIGVLKAFEISEETEVKSLTEKKKEKLKEYVSHVTAPSVDSVFAGKLDSIVVCHECHKESRVTESFLDLSLSLAVPKPMKGRLKTPGIPQKNKKNASHHVEKDNTAEDESSTKPQTPSKHQKKAAREARRKKGRKGKKRTVSRSTSDDGKQDKKQAEENMEATSDESEHEEHQDTEGTEDVINDVKNSEDTNMESSAKEFGMENCAKDFGKENIKETKDSGKSEVTKDSGIDEVRNSNMEKAAMDSGIKLDVAKDSAIEAENTKDPGTQNEILKYSGIEESIPVKEMTAKASEKERPQDNKGDLEMFHSQCVTQYEFELKGGTEEVTNETDVEKRFSEDQDGKSSNHTTNDFMDDTKFPNSNFYINEDEELGNSSNKINNGEEDSKSKEDLNMEHQRNRSNDVSYDRTASDHLRTKSVDGSVGCEEQETVKNNGTQRNKAGNLEEEKRDGKGDSRLANDMETVTEINRNLTLHGKESHSNSNNENGKLSEEENERRNSCESCGKVDQGCELKKKGCGCSKKDNATKKEAGETESASIDKEKIAKSVINGITKLEIHERQNNISGENAEELDNKDVEYNEQHPKMSPELERNAEERAASNEDSFLPKVHTLGPSYSSSQGECSVQSCLSLFCSPEILEGRNKFACEECSKRKQRDENDQKNDDEASSTDDNDDDESLEGATASKPKTNKESKRSVVYTEATKQLLLSYTPPVLTLHFKRFQQVGFGLRKVPKHVDFPLMLDLAPFCRRNGEISSDSKQHVLYSLIGVVEHSGGLNSGHYTACVKLKSSPTYGHFTDLSNIKDFASFVENMWKKNQEKSYAHAQPCEGQWYHVSDSRVTMVTEARVLKSQAYMLFYERLPFRICSNLGE